MKCRPDAARIGAVNTVRRDGNRLIGENTDGKGFLRGLRQEAGLEAAGKNVLLLGAGGAARAIAFELAAAGVGRLAIANRSAERGAALCADLRQRAGLAARLELWTGLCEIGAEVDILVNCTSIGLFPDVAALPAVDLGSGAARSAGLRRGSQSGGNPFHPDRARPGPENADRPAHAGWPGRHRI